MAGSEVQQDGCFGPFREVGLSSEVKHVFELEMVATLERLLLLCPLLGGSTIGGSTVTSCMRRVSAFAYS